LVRESSCRAVKDDGQPCRAPRLRDSDFCFWHSPEHADEAAEAQRLGGLRRRREKAVASAYDFDGLDSVPKARRLLEIAALDSLALENSVARSRTLAYLAQVALKALEVGEFEQRLDALERLVAPRLDKAGKRR